ncbi:MAG: phosphotransferase, partial [Pseudomonadota bacterium]
MAVYTPVSFEQASEHLQQFDLPELVKIQPIKAGVENSNFILHTKVKNYILTLFEKRVTADELPWFIALMQHLHTKKFPSPQPIANQKGEYLTSLNKRPALIVSFLEGKEITMVSAHHCFQVGYMLAKLHQSTRDFPLKRKNTLSNDHWKPIFIKYQDVFEQIAVNSKNE